MIKEHIIPANPIPIDLDKDEIIIRFNSTMDEDRAIRDFHYDLKCSIHSYMAKWDDEYFINRQMLERFEQENIKFRVIAPE